MTLRRSFLARFYPSRAWQAALLVLIGTTLGAVADRYVPWKDRSAPLSAELGARLRPGPWGELYRVPFHIAAPDELLPVRMIEEGGTHWLFKDFTISELSHLLNSVDLPADQQAALLGPAVAHQTPAGIELTPTSDMVVALPAQARQVIYKQLAQFPENGSVFTFIHKSTLDDRFGDSGVSRQTLALFHNLCCEQGDYLVFGGLPAMLARLPSFEEKLRFMKALTRQKTMLVRLRLTKDSDLQALSAYWGRGPWASNIRTILESIRDEPGDTFMGLKTLLPPEPASRLYFYPTIQSAPVEGHPVVHDCHWTSLNFFRDTADQQPVDAAFFVNELTNNYCAVAGDPRFGDILVLTKPNGDIVHSAVLIADDVVYTKNGATAIYPWMFSTVPDLLKQYSFLAPEGEQLTLHYFRNKSL